MSQAVQVLCAVRNRRCMQSLISELDDGENCAFDVVTTGTEALKACGRSVPDILVIDAVLPEMDGLAVIDRLKAQLGERMPVVIGGSRTAFSRNGFIRRGTQAVVGVPWIMQVVRDEILCEVRRRKEYINWDALLQVRQKAGEQLALMGMHTSLKGFSYLCDAAALAYAGEFRMFSIGRSLYEPIARYHNTTPQNVERLIRHAIESTMNAARAKGVYSLFGNTIDPAKGKPTNAQVIAMLVQQLRVEKNTV